MIHDEKRVDAIRRRIAAKLRILEQIENQADDNFRSKLQHPRNQIADIEKTLTDFAWRSRTPEQETHWLDGVEKFLRMAEHACQFWEDEFAKRDQQSPPGGSSKGANV